jgi:hypothetical protein
MLTASTPEVFVLDETPHRPLPAASMASTAGLQKTNNPPD